MSHSVKNSIIYQMMQQFGTKPKEIERSENIPGLKDGYCVIGW